MTPESGEHARLFDITDEEVGAAAAADAADQNEITDEGAGPHHGRGCR